MALIKAGPDQSGRAVTAKLKLGVLASGNGSNLQAIIDAIVSGELPASIELVLVNEPKAKALQRAEAAKVPARSILHRDFPTREAFDQQLVEALKDAGAEWVVLAGFMRLLSPTFLDQYPNRVLNIHPALLPAFPGIHAIRQALDAGVKVTGCTVHLVDHGVDSGPILAQSAVPVHDNDDEASLAERVHLAEHQLYVDTLRRLATGQLLVAQRRNAT
jgi:phosphoribosylglycinamide formyltransferase-1